MILIIIKHTIDVHLIMCTYDFRMLPESNQSQHHYTGVCGECSSFNAPRRFPTTTVGLLIAGSQRTACVFLALAECESESSCVLLNDIKMKLRNTLRSDGSDTLIYNSNVTKWIRFSWITLPLLSTAHKVVHTGNILLQLL